MTFYRDAQLFVEEPELHSSSKGEELDGNTIVVYDEEPTEEEVIEATPVSTHPDSVDTFEKPYSSDEAKIEISFKLPNLPGCDNDEPLELTEGDDPEKEEKDENDAKTKKTDPWDWQSLGAKEFLAWMKKMLHSVPKHSGKDSGGIERAVSYLKKLDSEISKAMQSDLNGEIDASKVEEARTEIDDGIERLEKRLSTIVEKFKGKKKKKAELENNGLVKSGQKAPSVGGVIITVPLLISRIARVCINSSVSSGKDIEDVFAEQVKKFDLTDREQAEVVQLLSDMNYTIRADLGFKTDESSVDERSEDNFNWTPQYPS